MSAVFPSMYFMLEKATIVVPHHQTFCKDTEPLLEQAKQRKHAECAFRNNSQSFNCNSSLGHVTGMEDGKDFE